MANVKCEKCGKEFASDHALKVHTALLHSGKPRKLGRPKKAAKAAPKKAAKKKKARRGKFVCSRCGRKFAMAMHLARHQKAAHGPGAKRAKKAAAKKKVARKKVVRKKKAARKVGRRPGRPRAVRSGVNVAAMPIPQLLALKTEVDARVGELVAQMRKANIRI